MRLLRRIRSGRKRAASSPLEALIGPGSARVPHLKWLHRSGALRLDPVLAEWVENWPDGEAEGPPAASGPLLELTGVAPDLAPLTTARGQALGRLRAMQRYCRTRRCRRVALLRYLGETPERRHCGSCDRCERGRRVAS